MEIENIETKKLTAGEGKLLTNGETYCKIAYLGINDKVENWWEVDESEYKPETDNFEENE